MRPLSSASVRLKQWIIEPFERGVNSAVGRAHYLPHHEVIRLDKETPKLLRVVYNASARKGTTTPSPNDCLYAGSPLSFHLYAGPPPFVLHILSRFRIHKIVILEDIEKTFLNVSVDPGERGCLRFLHVGRWCYKQTANHSTLHIF